MKKRNRGFTLAELLVVVAIVGILVAISVPVLVAQRKKAVIATNQANIRAAKAAAEALFYGSNESMDKYEWQEARAYRYYRYDTKKREIVSEAYGENTRIAYDDNPNHKKQVNELGEEYRQIAIAAKVPCTNILVYIGNPDASEISKDTAPIQTAPFYNGDEVGGVTGNPFGPYPGSMWTSDK